MKSIIALLVITCTVAFAQTNPPLTPEQEAANRLKVQQQMEAMKKSMEANIARAQQLAKEREAMMATSAPVQKLIATPIYTPPLTNFYSLTNASEQFAAHLKVLEEHYPGISTNFTEEQRNFPITKPIIRATRDKDGKLIYLSTNYPSNYHSTKGSQ